MLNVKPLYLLRHEDVNGKSGTGVVAVGAQFPSGIVIVEWLTFTSSLNQYRSLEHFQEVHNHEGRSEVLMGYPPDPSLKVKKPRKSKNET